MIGIMEGSNLNSTGWVASSGMKSRIRSRRSRRSLEASARSVPHWYSTTTKALPSLEVLVIFSTRLAEAAAFSMVLVRFSSTSSGDTPG